MRERLILKTAVVLVAALSAAVCTPAQNKKTMTPRLSGYAPVNGLKMYYEIYGEGNRPLLLIHGGGSTIESNYGYFLPLIAGYGEIIAIEMQAHGRTSDREGPETFEQDADDAAALLKYLKVEKANVLGFSDGGCTTLQLAMRHPEVVDRMVVVSSNYTRSGMIDGFFDMLARGTLDSMPLPLREAYLKVSPYGQAGLQRMFEKDVARRLSFRDFPAADLRAIKKRALLMVGDHDVIRTEHVVEMSRLISGSELVMLPGMHGMQLGEVCSRKPDSQLPAVTATIVQEFLAAVK